MKLALDFDKTYTLDPAFWREFIALSQAGGHEVWIVTFRLNGLTEEPEFAALERDLGVKTIFTDRRAKFNFCAALGHAFDVWIDDDPSKILFAPQPDVVAEGGPTAEDVADYSRVMDSRNH